MPHFSGVKQKDDSGQQHGKLKVTHTILQMKNHGPECSVGSSRCLPKFWESEFLAPAEEWKYSLHINPCEERVRSKFWSEKLGLRTSTLSSFSFDTFGRERKVLSWPSITCVPLIGWALFQNARRLKMGSLLTTYGGCLMYLSMPWYFRILLIFYVKSESFPIRSFPNEATPSHHNTHQANDVSSTLDF